MNVNELRDRIVELSHQSAADGEVQAKALGWLNAAYHEVMDAILPYAPDALQQQETCLCGADGVAALARVPYRLLQVIDVTTGRALPVMRTADVLAADPTGVATGTPQGVVQTATGVQVWPAQSVEVVVLYIPVVEDLAENGAESTVLLPKPYHQALVWGGLVWSSLFERGFGTQGELLIFQTQWAQAKERIKLALAGQSPLRVASW